MKTSEAKELFRQKTADFFNGYTVIWARQSRTPKPKVPLVMLTPGNVSRPKAANYSYVEGEPIGHYLSKIPIVVDLFTHGTPIMEEGEVVAYDNTAMDEILCFADFINSQKTNDWCLANNIAFLTDTDAQDLTGVVNDTNYEYRARITINVYFTQDTDTTIGLENTGYFSDTSIQGGIL
jgi:hypothetical protein